VVGVLRDWQDDASPVQLHPGDLGWFTRLGAEPTAAAVRTWSRGGRVLAVGLLDEPTVLRLAIDPDAQQDEELARALVADLSRPAAGVLVLDEGRLEAAVGSLVRDLVVEVGWTADEPWTALRRDLADAVEDPGVRVEVTGPGQVAVRTAVQRAAFETSRFTDDRWHAMAGGPAYADARCLVAHDDRGEAVAAVTVWSAGPGRPGLIEPLGVHQDHRGRGHGTAVTLAAAAALRGLGSSSAVVCTPSSNVGAVATYVSAGFRPLPEVPDLRRAHPA
jgi:ribosomal protein S18 acetylase RimI-like enzyme